jgi:5-methyltetrahydrofolate--homocysteine methyltransferase
VAQYWWFEGIGDLVKQQRRQTMSVIELLKSAVIDGKVDEISVLVEQATDSGLAARDVIDQGLLPGMDHVGVLFKAGDMFIPEVMQSAQAMQSALAALKPYLTANDVELAGRVVIGTVKGDLHSIGKNLVKMMLTGAGFDVLDLGIDVSPEAFVQAVEEVKPGIVGMSALLTTTMEMMRETINALVAAGVRDQVKIMIGGAPVTAGFSTEIGADCYAANAGEAVELAKTYFSKTALPPSP